MTDALKAFAGSGVEKQKGTDKAQSAADKSASDSDATRGEEAATEQGIFDKTGATCVVTHRSGPKRVWFRDGKEIGVEDAC